MAPNWRAICHVHSPFLSLASVFLSLTVIVTRALCQNEDESCLWKDKEPWQNKADTLQEKWPHLTASDQSHFSSDQDYRVYEFTETTNFVNNNVSTTTSLLYRQYCVLVLYCGLTPWVAEFRMCLGSTRTHSQAEGRVSVDKYPAKYTSGGSLEMTEGDYHDCLQQALVQLPKNKPKSA